MRSFEGSTVQTDPVREMHVAAQSVLDGLKACLDATKQAIQADDPGLRSSAQRIRDNLSQGFTHFDDEFLGMIARHVHGEAPISVSRQ